MKDKLLLLLGVAAAGAAVTATVFAIGAPLESTEGIVQKIYYIHVPCAFAAYLAFFVNLVASIVYLVKRQRSVDRFAAAGAEVGLMFCTLVLISGPLWAKPVWGRYWDWDPRLTSTLVLWFMYLGYIVLRGMSQSQEQGARFGAVLAIVAFVMVPIVHQAVELWGGIHPQAKSDRPDALAAGIRAAFSASALSFLVIGAFLVALRARVEALRDQWMHKTMSEGGDV